MDLVETTYRTNSQVRYRLSIKHYALTDKNFLIGNTGKRQ